MGKGWIAGGGAVLAVVIGVGVARAAQAPVPQAPIELISGVRLDGWIFVEEDRRAQKFYRREADVDGYPVLSNRAEYRVDQGVPGTPGFSYFATDAFRCSDGAVRPIARRMYAEHNLAGAAVQDNQVPLWEPVTPTSFMEKLLKIACDGKAAPPLPPAPVIAAAPAPIQAPPALRASPPPPAAEDAPEQVRLMPGVEEGDWIFAGDLSEGQLFIAAGKPTRSGNPVLRTRIEYYEPTTEGRTTFLSSVMEHEARCRDGRMRATRLTHYAQHNLKGRSTRGAVEDGWERPEGEGLIEIIASLCGEDEDEETTASRDDGSVRPIPGVILGEWTFFQEVDGLQIFLRRADTVQAENPQIWVRSEVRARSFDGKPIQSMLLLTEFDCARGTYHDLQFSTFSGHNMTGQQTPYADAGWQTVNEADVSGDLHDLMCKAPAR